MTLDLFPSGRAAPPRKFGDYEIIERLGYGGMAEVSLAQKINRFGFRKRVALKRILPHLNHELAFIEMFVDEARLASRMLHPNIAQVLDYGVIDNVYFMALEYIDGVTAHTLFERLRRTQAAPLKPYLAVYLASQVASALEYAHQVRDADGALLHLVHRDVSPSNIMVTRHGVVKLLDFGIAKAQARRTQTRAGLVKGKTAYMSPEQVQGEPLDAKSDQFSLALVLWESLTGRRVFQNDCDVNLRNEVAKCAIPAWPPETVASAALRHVVSRALAPNPCDRFASMQAFADALAPHQELSEDDAQAELGMLVEIPEQPITRVFGSLTQMTTHRPRLSFPVATAVLSAVALALLASPQSPRPWGRVSNPLHKMFAMQTHRAPAPTATTVASRVARRSLRSGENKQRATRSIQAAALSQQTYEATLWSQLQKVRR